MEIEKIVNKSFEDIKKVSKDGKEYWSARELYPILEYSQWSKFENVLEKSMTACKVAGTEVSSQFVQVGKLVESPIKGRTIEDFHLSRYACYLIVQNADSSKPVIAMGQTYFAIQTRRQELADNEAFQQMEEDKKRVFLRDELKKHNKQLVETASKAGVESTLDFAIFQNHGYKGLYGGLDAKDIHKKKGLKKSHKILDHMGSTELAANLFRATQAEEKLRRDDIKGKSVANKTHHEVGEKVRQTIEEIGGTMPENLPVPDKSAISVKKKMIKKLGVK